MAKFFLYPFAVSGSKSAVPDTTQVDGTVSYQEGYGADYSLDPTINPSALNIERLKMNEILYDITNAIREYQIAGTPDFITSGDNGGTAFSYSIDARVLYDAGSGKRVYTSLVNSNTALPTVTANWRASSSAVANLVGTTNRITIDSTDPANPIINISPAYIGQTSITTLGTIVTGIWNGTAVPVANGGTGSTSGSGARTALGLVIGSNVEAWNANLDAVAGLTSAADRLPYFTGSNTAALATFTAAGRALVDDADATAQRVTLGLGSAATLTAGAAANNVLQLNGSAQIPAVDASLVTNVPPVNGTIVTFSGVTSIPITLDMTTNSRYLIRLFITNTDNATLALTATSNGSTYPANAFFFGTRINTSISTQNNLYQGSSTGDTANGWIDVYQAATSGPVEFMGWVGGDDAGGNLESQRSQGQSSLSAACVGIKITSSISISGNYCITKVDKR